MEAYDDGTKRYIMQREQKNKKQTSNITAFSYQGGEACDSQDINVFVLFHDKDKKRVNDMQAELANKKILLTKGLAETTEAYGKKGDIIKSYDYFAVIISKSLLEDLDSLEVLLENYKTNASKKMLPMIVWKDLYEPEIKAEVFEKLQARIETYKEHHFKNDFVGVVANDLKRMQKILTMLEDFIVFAIEKDPKTSLRCSDKLLKYIRFVTGKDVADKEFTPIKGETNQTINIQSLQTCIATGSAEINATLNRTIVPRDNK